MNKELTREEEKFLQAYQEKVLHSFREIERYANLLLKKKYF
ncbi:hypothetical protein [Streptococcus massiliensis]|uniref:Uncharacterized protein n=1 Tax=Streptococcus massiliensis TaxID=313439 RepID=A0A380KWZ2_9STRE|nr:hypothetical protein [Streptococcus massiliensis]SUN76453.1 Uncharacterised protein [Streptococcus massiliensis]